jgi:hypothetical protein
MPGRAARFALIVGSLVGPIAPRADDAPRVTPVRTPDAGIQPVVATDAQGALHLVFFRGEPAAGDLYYAKRDPESGRFSTPIRVNSEPASAIAMGTIRGGQIAIGRDGRVHVAWNGSGKGATKNAVGSTPMLYSRSNAEKTGFEPQKNLMKRTSALDGGGSIAADSAGRVIVAWHGRTEDAGEGETGRQLYVARSTDDGASFADEVRALERPTGACACCGTKSLADRDGNAYVLFRAALTSSDRNLYLATSRDGGKSFAGTSIQPWKIDACPMSSESLAESNGSVYAAWETAGRVYFARIDPKSGKVGEPITPAGGIGRKHPSIAINAKGEVLLAWTEGTGWQRGGSLAWQVFDRAGKPIGSPGRLEGGIPTWGLPAAASMPDGSFVIVH